MYNIFNLNWVEIVYYSFSCSLSFRHSVEKFVQKFWNIEKFWFLALSKIFEFLEFWIFFFVETVKNLNWNGGQRWKWGIEPGGNSIPVQPDYRWGKSFEIDILLKIFFLFFVSMKIWQNISHNFHANTFIIFSDKQTRKYQ